MKILTPQSSNVYSFETCGNDLIVTFKDMSKYVYVGAANHYQGLVEAPSKGKYLNVFIKGRYAYRKIC